MQEIEGILPYGLDSKDIFASRHGKGKAVNLYKKQAQSGVYTNALVFALSLLPYNFVKPS